MTVSVLIYMAIMVWWKLKLKPTNRVKREQAVKKILNEDVAGEELEPAKEAVEANDNKE